MYKSIKTNTDNNTGIITLNRPENLNIIEPYTFDEIKSALDKFSAKPEIRVILINAECGKSKNGKKVFSAGVNLKKYPEKISLVRKKPEEFKKILLNSRELPDKIENYAKPVVIAIDGTVKGGFFEVALACDVILASKSASFSLSEVNLGLIPGYGGIHKLLRTVGKLKTFEIISSGREIFPEEAKQLGITAEVFEDGEFELKTIEYCENLGKKSPNALKLVKNTIYSLLNTSEVDSIELNNFIKAISHEESIEKIKDFLNI